MFWSRPSVQKLYERRDARGLVGHLAQEDAAEAKRLLGSLGVSAVMPLVGALGTPCRDAAVEVLADIGQSAVEALVDEIRFGDEANIDGAARALQLIRRNSRLPQWANEWLTDWSAETNHDTPRRQAAAVAVGRAEAGPLPSSGRPPSTLVRTITAETGFVNDVAIARSGHLALSGGTGVLVLWDLETGLAELTVRHNAAGFWMNAPIENVEATADGRRAIIGFRNASALYVCDLEPAKVVHTLDGHSETVFDVAMTPDGRRAVTGSVDTLVKVWDVKSGGESRTLRGHTDAVTAVAITPDGRLVISASQDETLKVWDGATGRLLRTLKGVEPNTFCLAITPDGRRAVSGSLNRKTVAVWDLELGTGPELLIGHTDCVNAVAIGRDGRLAVSGSSDKTLRVWDLATGQLRATLKGHTMTVTAVAIAPDCTRVISGSYDGTVKVWDIGDASLDELAHRPSGADRNEPQAQPAR
jgi:WD40 repeat protein